jgi:flavoprotein
MSAASIPIYEAALFLFPKEPDRICNACLRKCPIAATGVVYANGLEVECTGCGDERVIPFSRVTSEGA